MFAKIAARVEHLSWTVGMKDCVVSNASASEYHEITERALRKRSQGVAPKSCFCIYMIFSAFFIQIASFMEHTSVIVATLVQIIATRNFRSASL